MLKIIIINAKKGYLFREPTWMRRGAQGHVAAPCGPARALAWPRGDTWTHHLYLTYIVFNNMYRSSDYQKTIS